LVAIDVATVNEDPRCTQLKLGMERPLVGSGGRLFVPTLGVMMSSRPSRLISLRFVASPSRRDHFVQMTLGLCWVSSYQTTTFPAFGGSQDLSLLMSTSSPVSILPGGDLILIQGRCRRGILDPADRLPK
jgi:hypothetical protein